MTYSYLPEASRPYEIVGPIKKAGVSKQDPGFSKKHGFFQILENDENDVIAHDDGFLPHVRSLSPIPWCCYPSATHFFLFILSTFQVTLLVIMPFGSL